jgi:D-alanyl-D-alanine carboxypeptidase/D-alanyl-D-alanine-endopeptidase (penicillin-binding protein 4)
VPSKWVWEDIGNYYGAGVYGLSLFDNTLALHFKTGPEGSTPEITGYSPDICLPELVNRLSSYGNSDRGYVFAAPYGNYGWMTGTIPANRDDFVLKASITDPPMLIASLFDLLLDSAGIEVRQDPSTCRIENTAAGEMVLIAEVESPTLNHWQSFCIMKASTSTQSISQRTWPSFKGRGTTLSGIEVIYSFLTEAGVDTKVFL